MQVSEADIRQYCPVCEELARGFVGLRNAEADDLVQECLIGVWQAYGRGITPAKASLKNRMRDWVRLLCRQTRAEHGGSCGIREEGSYIGYDQLLPMDDFRTAGKVESFVAQQQERDADAERLG